jgi:lambda repressor-like predicted transcriptional regulator
MNTTKKLEIAQILREKTSMSVKDFAKKNYVSRKTLYDAFEGNSSRRVRVLIAKSVQIPPSMLWTENAKEKRIIDDVIYYTGAI